MCKLNSSMHRKFTWAEIQSWPEIHPVHELGVLQWLLTDLEKVQDFETCIIVKRRMDFLRSENNLQ